MTSGRLRLSNLKNVWRKRGGGGDGGVEVTHSVYGHPHPCLELSIVKDSSASVLHAVGSIGAGQDTLHRSAFGYKLSTSQALLCLNLIWYVG